MGLKVKVGGVYVPIAPPDLPDDYEHEVVDTRGTPTSPADYNRDGRWQFKANASIGIPSGNGQYSSVWGIRGWTDPSGDAPHEFAYTRTGNVYHRWSEDGTTTWGPWVKVQDATKANSFEGHTHDQPNGLTTTAPAANRFGLLAKWKVVGYTTFAVRLLVIAKGGDGQSVSTGMGSAVISVRIVGLAAGFAPAIVTVKVESGDTLVASDFRYGIGSPSIENVALYAKSKVTGEQYEVFELARSTNGTVNTTWGTTSDPWITFVPNDPPNGVMAYDASDLATAAGIIEARVATTANSGLSGLATVDGVTLATGDTVLVKNQSNPALNGPYVASPYAWERHPAANSAAELASLMVRVIGGSTQYGLWVCTFRASDTLGTTFQSWHLVTHAGAVSSLPSGSVVRLVYTTVVPSRPTGVAGQPYVEWVGAVNPGASALAGDTWINTN